MEVTQPPARGARGTTARFRIAWTLAHPLRRRRAGPAGCTTTTSSSQWFPKIGVFWTGGVERPPVPSASRVLLRLRRLRRAAHPARRGSWWAPRAAQRSAATNPDGTETFRFLQEDVHDFAWTASRRFLEPTRPLRGPGLPAGGHPPAGAARARAPGGALHRGRPHRAALLRRLVRALPYAQITVVDPAWGSGSGGMEYPTLITGGAGICAPPVLQSPESVTIHEAATSSGTGWWATTSSRRPGWTRGSTATTTEKAAPRWPWARAAGPPLLRPARRAGSSRLARGGPGRPARPRRGRACPSLRRSGETDVMARAGLGVPRRRLLQAERLRQARALSLQTLEGLVGEDTMTRILRTYARRYRFAHPTSRGLHRGRERGDGPGLAAGTSTRPGSRQRARATTRSRCANEPARGARGLHGRARTERRPRAVLAAARREADGPVRVEVTVRRLGEVRLPVEVLVEFADGRDGPRDLGRPVPLDALPLPRDGQGARAPWWTPTASWRWTSNPANNSWVEETGVAAPRRREVGGALDALAAEPAGAAHGARLSRRPARDAAASAAAGRSLGPRRSCSWPEPRCTAAVLAVPLARDAGGDLRAAGRRRTSMLYGFDYSWWSEWSDAQQGWPATSAPSMFGVGFAFRNLELLLGGPAARAACSRRAPDAGEAAGPCRSR